MSEKSKYRAPALQKGLEILELLAGSGAAMATADISAALGRSVSELFRMLLVLEEHGYIARGDDGYRLTNRLFALGMAQPPIRDLLTAALPSMHELARTVGQSCHMAVASGAEMVVVAHVETPGLLGFGVRLGYRRPLIHSASGLVLLACHAEPARAEMLRASVAAGVAFDATKLDARLAEVRATGRMMMPSPMLTAITDVSAPILQNGDAVAALTMPFVDGAAAMLALPEAAGALVATAAAISAAIAATP